MTRLSILSLGFTFFLTSCGSGHQAGNSPSDAHQQVRIITLDPGHFHAALIQKTMYDQIDRSVYVYAPAGPDVQDHIDRIKGYNTREENPTSWEETVYTGSDFFERMVEEKPGNVVVLSGNNAKKTDYILKTIQAGLNVFADKPMAISPRAFSTLEQAFKTAEENQLLLYDIMTERYEITNILQRELSKMPDIFGHLETGSLENPAITRESVHHFFKYVSGQPLKRPAWYFDVAQQGEGIVDVNTHLVDLIQWDAFPEVALKKEDVEIVSARHWTTDLSPKLFAKVTQLDKYPDYLQKDVTNDTLKVYSNGEINYKLKGIHARTSVVWNFQAPEGSADTHYAIMRGSGCNLIIKQGPEQGYKPTLYVEATRNNDLDTFAKQLQQAVDGDLATRYPGVKLIKAGPKTWVIEIPDRYKVGHEAQFQQVTEKYLQYIKEGRMPAWEVPNMIVKYHTTTEGLKFAMRK